MTSTKNLAFIGLGVMGYPMAGHLSKAGHRVTVFNRTKEKALSWLKEFDGNIATSPAEAARGQDAVLICVGNDEDVHHVVAGDHGILETLSEDTLVIDHTTTSAKIARSLAELAKNRNASFLDAPVSGGQIGAERGQLTVMVGATEANYQRVVPLIDCYAKSIRRMGPIGAGQLTKMVNQICIAGLLQGLSEGIHFAEKARLDPQAAIDIISHGAAQSWQMDNRAKTMIDGEYQFGFAVDLMRKDLQIAINAAKDIDADLPITKIIDGFYRDLQEMDGGRWDTSSLLERLRLS